jgi:dethiobiotin synthetase/adenosylmethionine--8-amino-7-oxononanoate aminotransferase
MEQQQTNFSTDRLVTITRGTPLASAYAKAIDKAIDDHEKSAEADGSGGSSSSSSSGRRLGALLMEPVLQGAGGMLCVDPAFQRALVQVSQTADRR